LEICLLGSTPYCLHHGQQAHEGKIYKLDDQSAPRIPGHINCRSLWLYKIAGVDPFSGTKAAVGGKKSESAAEDFANRWA